MPGESSKSHLKRAIKDASIYAWMISAYLDLLEEGTRNWRVDLGHISDAAVTWQPFARGHNISAMLLHMADIESIAIEEAVLSRPRCTSTMELFGTDFFEAKPGEWSKPLAAGLEWHYAIQDAVRSTTIETLSNRDPQEEILHPAWGTLTIASLILRLIQHEAYHSGQIVLHKIHYGWGGVEPALAA